MASNHYLFDPTRVNAVQQEKPLVQVLRDAEVARSMEGARIIRSAFSGIANFFERTTTSGDVVTRREHHLTA